MNKQQFINVLQKHLAPLSKEERNELISEYESHFLFGIQNGKTEEEISTELGDPIELAKEVLGVRYINPDRVAAGVESSRTIFSFIMIIFVNLIMVPLGVSFWLVVFSFGLAGFAMIMSPLLVLANYTINQSFYVSNLFASIGMVGLGILLAIGTYYMTLSLWKITRSYMRWNMHTVKGRN